MGFVRGVLPGGKGAVSGGLLSGGVSGSSVGVWVPGVVGVLPGSGSVSGLLGGSSVVGVDGSLVFGLGVGEGALYLWGGELCELGSVGDDEFLDGGCGCGFVHFCGFGKEGVLCL